MKCQHRAYRNLLIKDFHTIIFIIYLNKKRILWIRRGSSIEKGDTRERRLYYWLCKSFCVIKHQATSLNHQTPKRPNVLRSLNHVTTLQRESLTRYKEKITFESSKTNWKNSSITTLAASFRASICRRSSSTINMSSVCVLQIM